MGPYGGEGRKVDLMASPPTTADTSGGYLRVCLFPKDKLCMAEASDHFSWLGFTSSTPGCPSFYYYCKD